MPRYITYLVCLLITSCNEYQNPKVRLFVFDNSSADISLLVNGKPFDEFELHVPGWDVYAPTY